MKLVRTLDILDANLYFSDLDTIKNEYFLLLIDNDFVTGADPSVNEGLFRATRVISRGDRLGP